MTDAHSQSSPSYGKSVTFYHLLGTALLVILTTLALFAAQYRQVQKEINADLEHIGNSYLPALASALDANDHNRLHNIAQTIVSEPHVHYLVVNQSVQDNHAPYLALGHKQSNDQTRKFTLANNGKIIGQLQIDIDDPLAQLEVSQQLWPAIAVFVVGLLVIGWLSLQLGHTKTAEDTDKHSKNKIPAPPLQPAQSGDLGFTAEFVLGAIQGSTLMVMRLDPDLYIKAINPAVVLNTGLIEEELIDHNWLDVFIPPAQHGMIQQRLDQSLSIEGLLSPSNHASEELDLNWFIAPFTDSLGRLSFVACGIDISELRNQLLFQESSQKRAGPSMVNPMMKSEEMEALGNMVAGIAHETNTPLGICVTNASLLRENTMKIEHSITEQKLTKSQMQEFLVTVRSASNLMITNLHQASELLKSFKQVAVDQTSQQGYLFNVRENLQQVITSLGHQLRQKSINIQVDCPNHLKINSYPGRFAQIYSNLLMNSILHAFNDIKVTPTINIQIERHKQRLTIDYQDNGQGIDSSIRDQLFEPFVTTRRDKGGSGLGTYIVHQLVTENLSGEIECYSVEPHGTGFRIDIPIQHFEDDSLQYSD